MLTDGQISMLILSIIGLSLNLLVGSIVTIGLKLITDDLVMILIITISDSVFYLQNLIRIILTTTQAVKVTYSYLELINDWWCPLDLTLSMTLVESSVDLVAVLSVMRYLKVCHQKEIKGWIWYTISTVTVLVSAAISLGNYNYKYFVWSRTKMFCLTFIPDEPSGLDNRSYYLFFYFTYVVRAMISLLIIIFCYFKVITTYRTAINPKLVIPIDNYKMNIFSTSESDLNNPKPNTIILQRHSLEDNYKLQRTLTTVKILSATIAYIVCLLPDIIFAILNLAYGINPTPFGAVVSNSLLCCVGIVSPLFLLFTHSHSRNYLKSIVTGLARRCNLI